MPKFKVEQYEIHVTAYEIEADSPGEAIAKINEGDGLLMYTNYVEVAEDRGMWCGDLTKKDCEMLGISGLDRVSGICSVEKME